MGRHGGVRAMLRGVATLGVVSAIGLTLALPGGVVAAEGEVGPEGEASAVAIDLPAVATAPLPVQAGALGGVGGAGTPVTMVDNRNLPAKLTVAVGTTVTWTNNGIVPHTVSAAGGSFDSGNVQPGESFSFTFDAPGEYGYFCRPHVFIGMTGTVVVQ
jgi:nitrite reductase (NO-forming)